MNFLDLYDDGIWNRSPYAVRLGDEFESLQEAMTYMLAHNYRIHSEMGEGNAFNKLLQAGENEANPEWYTRPYYADTTPGGNDAINCYWQFNRDDDIVMPITRSGDADDEGMGLYYSEVIESNQQICWFTFGVPEFSNPAAFYSDAVDAKLSVLMRNGNDTLSVMGTLGNIIGDTVGLLVSIPLTPLVWLNKIFNWANTFQVTKYYDFKQTMMLYYKFVNSILTHLAVNMGFLGEMSHMQNVATNQNSDFYPTFIKKTGTGIPDIFAIIQQRAKKANPSYNIVSTDDRISQLGGIVDWFTTFISGMSSGALGAGDYVGFRIEKSTDSQESFSNQTGESSIASTLNGMASSSIESNYSTQGIMGSVKDALVDVAGAVGLSSATSVLLGNAFIDIPDVWKGSGFNKSYSINFKLRSPNGDKISIMQSIYLPLAMILAGTLPRAAGKNSYTSPFLCRCYCKGMFAIPLGIIESLSIQRGGSEYGWNNENLPIAVDVSVSIKDLSPALYMSLGTDKWTDIFGQNSSFQEYMLTLAGVGLNERVLYLKNLKRRMQVWLEIRKSTGLVGLLLGQGSPYYWGAYVGNSRVARTIGSVLPMTNYGNN